jgi:hypothetical protein
MDSISYVRKHRTDIDIDREVRECNSRLQALGLPLPARNV